MKRNLLLTIIAVTAIFALTSCGVNNKKNANNKNVCITILYEKEKMPINEVLEIFNKANDLRCQGYSQKTVEELICNSFAHQDNYEISVVFTTRKKEEIVQCQKSEHNWNVVLGILATIIFVLSCAYGFSTLLDRKLIK